ncbi:uncharacterized protein LOC144928229 [Branchiostoma floridae x Branchiostoma belcheri]
MATFVTVATLSPRCYQEALDIMYKWSTGQCLGQGKSLKVTQTIFKPLNGLDSEKETFTLLRRLHTGLIDKDQFDAEAKAKKRSKEQAKVDAERKVKELQEEVKELEKKKKLCRKTMNTWEMMDTSAMLTSINYTRRRNK